MSENGLKEERIRGTKVINCSMQWKARLSLNVNYF